MSTIHLISKELVSGEYPRRLGADLVHAEVCRFMVAYVTNHGINAIGRNALVRVMQHERSFGVATLTCSCGFEPLLELNKEVCSSFTRFRYFMDPKERPIRGESEPREISLFHSKVVYLYLPKQGKSVIYIGSHNWSKRALGEHRPRNAEASIRIEIPFEPSHLDGVGNSLASEVNRHLLLGFENPACLPADEAHRTTFEQWHHLGCSKARSDLDEFVVITAVCNQQEASDPSAWNRLIGGSIYAQILDPLDGDKIRSSQAKVLVLAWKSINDFRASRQPYLIRCHVSTQNPGPGSKVRGSNSSPTPIAGFTGVLFDGAQLDCHDESRNAPTSTSLASTGRIYNYFDFEFPTQHESTATVDGNVFPPDQFLLEVDDIIFPLQDSRQANARLSWPPGSLAFAKSKADARFERLPGYAVSEDLYHRICNTLENDFGVDLARIKVKPAFRFDSAKAGLRISRHPLHDTYLGHSERRSRDYFYEQRQRGLLVAEIDETEDTHIVPQLSQPEPRTQKVFTSNWESLVGEWSEAARNLAE